jgi:peptidoglycan/LPS O-acetylase OafA/YrhL
MGFTMQLSGWMYFAIALLAVLIFSAISFEILEKPLNRLAKKIGK